MAGVTQVVEVMSCDVSDVGAETVMVHSTEVGKELVGEVDTLKETGKGEEDVDEAMKVVQVAVEEEKESDVPMPLVEAVLEKEILKESDVAMKAKEKENDVAMKADQVVIEKEKGKESSSPTMVNQLLEEKDNDREIVVILSSDDDDVIATSQSPKVISEGDEDTVVLSSDDEATRTLGRCKSVNNFLADDIILLSSDDESSGDAAVTYTHVSNTPNDVQIKLKSEMVEEDTPVECTPTSELTLVPATCTPSSEIEVNVGTPLSCLGSNCSGSFLPTNVEGPKVGMKFDMMQEVEVYYKTYAKEVGFGVSRVAGSYYKSKDGVKQRRSCIWKCEYYGSPESQKSSSTQVGGSEVVDEAKAKRTSKKCGCTAMIYACLNKEGVWEIRKVELHHLNHIPTPRKSTLVKEYRMDSFTKPLRRRLLNDLQSGLSVAKIHGCMALERDGIHNMVVTQQDMRHVAAQHRRLKMVGGDANAMLAYFEKMQSDNQQFFHSHRLDEDGVMKDVVWVDARSRVAYEDFGDVVCFDATYLTNHYDLPFANFVGVNHHGQSILLGCALVSKEDTETYKWVFHQWMVCMGGRKPNAIVTDQAQPIGNAIKEVLPETRHRWCLWHIMEKVPRKLGAHKRYDTLSVKLKEVVYDTHYPEEFENNWANLIAEYKLENDEWLTGLFADRHMWVPAFLNDIFWAGMRTTQRVESMNSFFDKYVTRHTRLYEFPEKYCAAMEQRVKDELDEDLRSMKYIRKIVSGYRWERVFQRIYTSRKFREVQKQCERVSFCVPKEEHTVGEFVEHILEDRIWVIPQGKTQEVVTDKRRYYKVCYNPINNHVVCQCKMFETNGILCRHAIRVLDQHLHGAVPERYILRRWRKDVPRRHSKVKVAYHDPTKTVEVKRYDAMMVVSEELCEIAKDEDETMNIVLDGIKSVKANILKLFEDRNSPSVNESQERNAPKKDKTTQKGKEKEVAKDPKVPTKKRGRPPTKRKENIGDTIRNNAKKSKLTKKKEEATTTMKCVRPLASRVPQVDDQDPLLDDNDIIWV